MPQLRLRPLGFGEILDGAFTLYRQHFATFFITALICVIPITLLTRLFETISLYMGDPSAATAAALALLLLVPVSMVLWALLYGALTQQTAQAYEGERPEVGAAYARGLRALIPMIASWILLFLLGMGLFIALTIVALIVAIPFAAFPNAVAAVASGAVLAVVTAVVGFLAFTSIFAVFPAIIVERLGPWAAIKRSHGLARGGRLRILGISVVTLLIVLLPTLGLMAAAGMGAAMWDVSAAVALSPVQRFVQLLVGVLASSLTTPFMVGCFTLLYFDRRIRAEGYDLEVAAEALAAHAAE